MQTGTNNGRVDSLGSGLDKVVAIHEGKSSSSDLVQQSKSGKSFVQKKNKYDKRV